MRSAGIYVLISVVIVVAVAGLLAARSVNKNSLPLEPSPTMIDSTDLGGASNSGQFLQQEPSNLPAVTGAQTATSPTVTAPTASQTMTISIDDTGFTPSEVTISSGTAVTFINNGQGLHWPASDNHPTHQLLPGFDAGRGLTTGETYSFTFTKTGRWTMHDHLHPSASGMIIVQ